MSVICKRKLVALVLLSACSIVRASETFKNEIKIFPGSKVVSVTSIHGDDYLFPVAINSQSDPLTWGKLRVSGKNVIGVYSYEGSASVDVIFRSLIDQFAGHSPRVYIDCAGKFNNCGYYMPRKLLFTDKREKAYKKFDTLYNLYQQEYRFYSASFGEGQSERYVAIIVAKEKGESVRYSIDVAYTEHAAEVMLVSQKKEAQSVKAKEKISMNKDGRAILKGLYFYFDKAQLKEESLPFLEKIADYLKSNPVHRYTIVGHTDSSGSKKYNKNLSEERAAAVKRELVNEFGVSDSQLSVVGHGEASPVASNESKAGRAENRRVELVLIGEKPSV